MIGSFVPCGGYVAGHSMHRIMGIDVKNSIVHLGLDGVCSVRPMRVQSVCVTRTGSSSSVSTGATRCFGFNGDCGAIVPTNGRVIDSTLGFGLEGLRQMTVAVGCASTPRVPAIRVNSHAASCVVGNMAGTRAGFTGTFQRGR